MTYAMADIPTILPHVCVACKIVNENGSIFIPSKTLIKQASNIVVKDIKSYNFDRISSNNSKRFVHIRTHGLNFPVGILSSFDSLEDSNLKETCRRILMQNDLCNGYGPFVVPREVIKNYFKHHTMPFYMLIEFLKKCPRKELYKSLSPLHIYKKDGNIYIIIFGLIRTKIWKTKVKNK